MIKTLFNACFVTEKSNKFFVMQKQYHLKHVELLMDMILVNHAILVDIFTPTHNRELWISLTWLRSLYTYKNICFSSSRVCTLD